MVISISKDPYQKLKIDLHGTLLIFPHKCHCLFYIFSQARQKLMKYISLALQCMTAPSLPQLTLHPFSPLLLPKIPQAPPHPPPTTSQLTLPGPVLPNSKREAVPGNDRVCHTTTNSPLANRSYSSSSPHRRRQQHHCKV